MKGVLTTVRHSIIYKYILFVGVVHENTRIGSDGESEDVSGTSDEKDYQHSPVKLRQPRHRRTNEVR